MASARRVVCQVVCAATALLGAAHASCAADVPYWPNDQAARLQEVDRQVVQKMDELSAARLRNETDKVEQLNKEFKDLQDERIQLLRASGQLPNNAHP